MPSTPGTRLELVPTPLTGAPRQHASSGNLEQVNVGYCAANFWGASFFVIDAVVAIYGWRLIRRREGEELSVKALPLRCVATGTDTGTQLRQCRPLRR